ncbi:hypothetical protein APS_0447 [Acetobacter pasteurianus subsp. pasteurianus LMG 1262 = NBRC 106471]|nr:hypothetical protein APS_0447 [Acetobacter pasteurianus subsp. pasteurianus LMG 1262 = NBRC 106471]
MGYQQLIRVGRINLLNLLYSSIMLDLKKLFKQTVLLSLSLEMVN